jgi:hypothetical protein
MYHSKKKLLIVAVGGVQLMDQQTTRVTSDHSSSMMSCLT